MKLSIPQTLTIAALLLASAAHCETITVKVKLMVAVGIPAGAHVYPQCEIYGTGNNFKTPGPNEQADLGQGELKDLRMKSKDVPYAEALVPKLLPNVPGSSNFIGSTDVVFLLDGSPVLQGIQNAKWTDYNCRIFQVTANGVVTELNSGPNPSNGGKIL